MTDRKYGPKKPLLEKIADEVKAERLRLAAMPTGPWVEGNEPKEEGEYLVTARWAGHSGQFVTIALWRDKEWLSEDGYEMEFVTRYAKINEVPDAN